MGCRMKVLDWKDCTYLLPAAGLFYILVTVKRDCPPLQNHSDVKEVTISRAEGL